MRRLLITLARLYKAIVRLKLKLLGRTAQSDAAHRIATGRSWDEFCDTLKGAGANIMSARDIDDRTRAEGLRYLSRLTRAGLEAFLEYADPTAPTLRQMVHETVKMGADNPDNIYLNAPVRGDHTYRITGNRGTVGLLTFSTQKGGYGQSGGLPPTGFIDSRELTILPGNQIHIVVSKEPPDASSFPDANWLPMAPDSGLLMVRQTFCDRPNEIPAKLRLEVLPAQQRPLPPSALSIDQGLKDASNLVAGASFLFAKWADDFKKHTNQLPLFDPAKSTAAGGDPQIAYYHSYFHIEPDQALVIDAHPPQCENWNFQLNNHWMESLDYRYHKIHINKQTAVYRQNGSVEVVVAHKDPGHPNWLSTTGLTRGTMCWRWIRAVHHPQPTARLVPLGDVIDSNYK